MENVMNAKKNWIWEKKRIIPAKSNASYVHLRMRMRMHIIRIGHRNRKILCCSISLLEKFIASTKVQIKAISNMRPICIVIASYWFETSNIGECRCTSKLHAPYGNIDGLKWRRKVFSSRPLCEICVFWWPFFPISKWFFFFQKKSNQTRKKSLIVVYWQNSIRIDEEKQKGQQCFWNCPQSRKFNADFRNLFIFQKRVHAQK